MNCQTRYLVLFSFTLGFCCWLWFFCLGSFIHHNVTCFSPVTFPLNGTVCEATSVLRMQLHMQPILAKVAEMLLINCTTNWWHFFCLNLSSDFKISCWILFIVHSFQFGTDTLFHADLHRSLKTWRTNHYEKSISKPC